MRSDTDATNARSPRPVASPPSGRGDARTIEKNVRIAAPADAVWAALTDPRELQRWFPLQAEVEPGAGGTIWMAWGDYWKGTHNIEIWEPNHHLRTLWPVGNEIGQTPDGDTFEAPTGADGRMAELTVDYLIEGEGGSTKLRLVHTGFGKGALWDDWYDGTRRGWDYELESLRHYLEKHRGTDRRVAWARRAFDRRGAHAFDAVFGPDGLITSGTVAGLKRGDAYSLRTFDGAQLEGNVVVNERGAQFAATVESLNDAFFRIESFCHGDKQELSVFVATWGVPEEQVGDLERRWKARLDELVAA